VKTLTSRAYIPSLVLLALACLPVAAHADTLTLDGAPVISLSFGTDTFTVLMDSTDAAPYLADDMLGTKIDLLTLGEVSTVDGITTEDVLEFKDDVVAKFQYPNSDGLTADVTFDYDKFTISTETSGGDGSGGGNTVPEPSSAALLASGLLGMVGFGRKKLFNQGGKR